jgi:hypothetical protein
MENNDVKHTRTLTHGEEQPSESLQIDRSVGPMRVVLPSEIFWLGNGVTVPNMESAIEFLTCMLRLTKSDGDDLIRKRFFGKFIPKGMKFFQSARLAFNFPLWSTNVHADKYKEVISAAQVDNPSRSDFAPVNITLEGSYLCSMNFDTIAALRGMQAMVVNGAPYSVDVQVTMDGLAACLSVTFSHNRISVRTRWLNGSCVRPTAVGPQFTLLSKATRWTGPPYTSYHMEFPTDARGDSTFAVNVSILCARFVDYFTCDRIAPGSIFDSRFVLWMISLACAVHLSRTYDNRGMYTPDYARDGAIHGVFDRGEIVDWPATALMSCGWYDK